MAFCGNFDYSETLELILHLCCHLSVEPRSCGLYYKHTMIVNYASSIVNKLEALLTDNARVIIYDRHVFIVQATDPS